jgi:hypothetical protein
VGAGNRASVYPANCSVIQRAVSFQEDDDDDPDGAVKAEPKKTKKKSTWYRNLSDALADSRYGASAIETHDTAPAPHNGYASDFPTYEFMVTRKSKLKEHEIEVREAAKARRARSGKHPASPTAATRHSNSENDSASSDGGSEDETSDESDDSDVEAGHRRRGSRHRTSSKVLRKLEQAGDGQPALMPLLVNWVLRVVKRALSTTRAVSGKAVSIIGAAGSSAAVKLADYSVVAASCKGVLRFLPTPALVTVFGVLCSCRYWRRDGTCRSCRWPGSGLFHSENGQCRWCEHGDCGLRYCR